MTPFSLPQGAPRLKPDIRAIVVLLVVGLSFQAFADLGQEDPQN
jgi:hypothetical protein